jgi:hypothetical protein
MNFAGVSAPGKCHGMRKESGFSREENVSKIRTWVIYL